MVSRITTETTDVGGACSSAVRRLRLRWDTDRILTPIPRSRMVYGYQGFDFSVLGTAFHSHVIQRNVRTSDLRKDGSAAGAGPQITRIGIACTALDALVGVPPCTLNQSGQSVGSIPNNRTWCRRRRPVCATGLPRTSLDLTYQRFETSGSGLFAGAQSDIARLTADSSVVAGVERIRRYRVFAQQPSAESELRRSWRLASTLVSPTRAVCLRVRNRREHILLRIRRSRVAPSVRARVPRLCQLSVQRVVVR